MSDKRRLCIIPCGSAKIWDKHPNAGPQKASDVYTGVFADACQRYAKAFFEDWVILSAKHGFLLPDDIVHESYNVSFIRPNQETIGLEELKQQAQDKGLLDFREVTVLGGKHYVERVNLVFNQGHAINLPLRDCKGIGYMLQRLVNALGGNPNVEKPEIISASRREAKSILRMDREVPLLGNTVLYTVICVRKKNQ